MDNIKLTKAFDKWVKINDMWEEIAEGYYNFSLGYKKELFNNFNIDSGTDYANYILNIGNIER